MELESIVVVNDDQPEQRQEENRVNSDLGGENGIDEFIPVTEQYPDIPMRLDGERVSIKEIRSTYLLLTKRMR